MSLYKRIWIDQDPQYADLREQVMADVWQRIEEFKFPIPIRRRNKWADRPHWDPLWPSSLTKAADELEIESMAVNSQMRFRTSEQRDAVKERAEAIWQEKIAQRTRPR